MLSDAARELQQAQANGPASGALSAARMRQVSERLAQGFYERPEVRSEVLRRLAGDPENSSQGA